MKKPKLKLFEKKDNYDDLLEMAVNNKYRIWIYRILLFVFMAVVLFLIF